MSCFLQFSPAYVANWIDFFLLGTEKGNLTTYEWQHGEAPLKIEAPQLVNYTFDDEELVSEAVELDLGGDGIDFGDLGTGDDIQLETGNENSIWYFFL